MSCSIIISAKSSLEVGWHILLSGGNKLFKLAELLEVSVSQILNFDASQIFNVKDYGIANVDIHSQTNNYTDPYKDKYIQLLEAEVARLKKLEEK